MATTLFINIEDVGRFELYPRTGDKALAVAAEFHRLTQGQEIGGVAGYMTDAVAHLKVLVKTAPDGWDLDAMDYWDAADGQKVVKVFEGWKAEYARFRGAKPADAEATGENSG